MIKEEQDNLTQKPQAKRYKKNLHRSRKKQVVNMIAIVFFILVWALVCYKGLTFGKQYLDNHIAALDAKNQSNYQMILLENASLNKKLEGLNHDMETFKGDVVSLNEAIEAFGVEVASLKSSIDFIDTSVGTSITVLNEMGNMIQALDNRLEELKTSLKILSEAP